MQTNEIVAQLEAVKDLVSDLRFAAEMAEKQGSSVETAIWQYTQPRPQISR